MNQVSELVMPHETIVRKLDRMAREILEVHFQESTLVLLGVDGQGVALCQALVRRRRGLVGQGQSTAKWRHVRRAQRIPE